MNVKEVSNFQQIVALKDVKCFAYHGFYPEEQILGCYFIVDLEVSFIPKDFNDELTNTVNYEELNKIILLAMEKTQKLLETVLNSILKQVIKQYPFINSASVSIKKLNPLMQGEVGQSFVKLSYCADK